MKRLWFILLVPLFAQETEKEDSTVVILKSGEIKQVQNSRAYIEFVNPLQMNIEVIDGDSIKYDIYDIVCVFYTISLQLCNGCRGCRIVI